MGQTMNAKGHDDDGDDDDEKDLDDAAIGRILS